MALSMMQQLGFKLLKLLMIAKGLKIKAASDPKVIFWSAEIKIKNAYGKSSNYQGRKVQGVASHAYADLHTGLLHRTGHIQKESYE